MIIKMIADVVRNWGAPSNWTVENGVCGGLPCTVKTDGGVAYWVSSWEPTPEELVELNKGGTIHLWVSANQHPVVAMSVNPMVEED